MSWLAAKFLGVVFALVMVCRRAASRRGHAEGGVDEFGIEIGILLIATGLLGTACQAPGTRAWPTWSLLQDPEETEQAQSGDASDQQATAAENVDPAAERDWSVGFRFPVQVGFTNFDLGGGEALKSLATLAVVPTAELSLPLGEDWTLLPFLGLGGGWLIDSNEGIWILTAGARVQWLHELDEPTSVRVVPRVRYDANLNRPDGLLGDWGRTDLAVELRRALGSADSAVRFEPGVYAQGFWFWDDVEFEVPGLTPDSVSTQAEFGLSLGTRDPIAILGIELPRIFVGYRFGDGVETFSIQLGEL